MNGALGGNDLKHGMSIDLAVGPAHGQSFSARYKMTQGVALVRFQMRMLMRDDSVIALQEGAQGEAIRARAIGYKVHATFLLENLAPRRLCAFGIIIMPITDDMPLVRLGDSREHFRRDPGIVVTGEMARSVSHAL